MTTTWWSEQVGGSGSSVEYRYREGYKQRPVDFSKVLPYSARYANVWFVGNPPNKTYAWQVVAYAVPDQFDALFPGLASAAQTLAYEDLVDQLSSASLGETFAELGDSASMIADRSIQLLRFATHLKRGRLQKAWQVLRVSAPPPKRWHSSKSFTGLFLEAHLGWEPLIKDIHSAVEVLQSPIPVRHSLKGRNRQSFKADVVQPVHVYNPNAWYPSNNLQRSYTRIHGDLRVRMGCVVTVNNPNAYLANQLGLANPLSVAWALVPFSFVADWFGTLGTVIGSMTDFMGLTVENGWTTTRITGAYENFYEARYRWLEGSPPRETWGGGVFQDTNGTFSGTERKLGVTLPTLMLRPYKNPSLVRAATAVSLLTQFLGK